jgi:hypothetical protein
VHVGMQTSLLDSMLVHVDLAPSRARTLLALARAEAPTRAGHRALLALKRAATAASYSAPPPSTMACSTIAPRRAVAVAERR